MTEHRTLFPMCPFVNGLEVGNIPLGGASGVPMSPGHDEVGLRWSQQHTEPNSTCEKVKKRLPLNIDTLGFQILLPHYMNI